MCNCYANHPSNEGKRPHEMTDLKIQKFQRKPFPVEGVRVTKDNMEKVAAWSNGEVRTSAKGVQHVFIDVHRPMTERQTMAFVGDWILFADRGFKIYTQNAFSRNFELLQAGTGADHADFEPVKEKDDPIPEVDIHAAAQRLQQHFREGDPSRT